MAVTWAPTNISEGVAVNGKRSKFCVLTATGTYTTGGDAFSPATVGLKGISRLMVQGSALVPGGWTLTLAGSTEAPLIQGTIAATGGSGAVAEIANATTLTGKTFAVYFEGF